MTAEVCCHTFVITHLMSDFMLFYIIVIRRLITVIRCQTFDNSYITADVWCYMLCYITVIRHLMSNIRRLITVIWCQTSKVRHLIWDVCCHNFYQTSDVRRNQTSDNSYMTADVLCQMSNITRLLSYNCYQTSDVWFYMMLYNCYQTSDNIYNCYQMCDNSYMMSDVR